MCMKTNTDKGIHNFGLLLYSENLNVVFFYQYSTENTFVLEILAEMCHKYKLFHNMIRFNLNFAIIIFGEFGAPNTLRGL